MVSTIHRPPFDDSSEPHLPLHSIVLQQKLLAVTDHRAGSPLMKHHRVDYLSLPLHCPDSRVSPHRLLLGRHTPIPPPMLTLVTPPLLGCRATTGTLRTVTSSSTRDAGGPA
jgi:hypothetical protein